MGYLHTVSSSAPIQLICSDQNITTPKYPISIDNNAMQQKIRRYNITLRDHVQLLGYRGQIELIGKDLGLHGIVFNAPDGSVKVVAEGEESVIDVFFDDLKRIREGVDIETLEYMKRFDKGIDLLTDIKSDNREFLRNTNLLVNGQDKLVEGQNQMNNGQNKVIALLEKIESKFK